MAVAIAELMVLVGADVSAAIAGLTAVGAATDSLVGKFRAAQPAALLVEAAAVGIGAGLFEATKVAASFEQAMANVRAVMTPSEIQQFGSALDDLAIQLGQKTVFSAREAAAGIGELIRAGVPAADILNGAAQAALNLASATNIPVSQAATIAAQAMNAFSREGLTATQVADILAGTANATAANMTDLQQGLQVVAATATNMGLSFLDTSTALGVFVQHGQTGATAGTGLRQMLLELQPTTKPAKELMQQLGLSVHSAGDAFFDATGHIKSMADISQVLQNALKGMSDEQKIAALNTLFTRDAINSALILSKEGADGINKYSGEIQKISAAEQAAERLNTLLGSINNLGSSIETAQIKIGEFFIPEVRLIADTVRGATDAFSNLDPGLQRNIVFFIGIAGAIAGLIGTFVLLAPFLAGLPGAFAALGGALGAVAPFFLAAAAVAAGLVLAWRTNFGNIQGIVQGAMGRVKDIFDRVSPLFSHFGIIIQRALSGDVGGAFDSFRQIIGTLSPDIGRLLDTLGELKDGIVRTFKDAADAITSSPLGKAVGAVFDTIGAVFRAILDGRGQEILDFFGNLLPKPIKDLAASVGPDIAAAFGAIETVFDTILSGRGKEIIDFFTDKLPQPFKDLGRALEGPVTATFSALGTIFGLLVSGHGQEALDFFKQSLPDAFKTLGGAVEGPIGTVFSAIGSIFQAIVTGNGQLVLDFFSAQLPQALKDFGSKVDPGAALGTLINSMSNLVTAVASVDPAKVIAVGQAFGGNFLESFRSLGTQLQPLVPVFQSLGAFFGSVVNVITAFDQLRSRGQGGAGAEDPLISPLQRLADFVKNNLDLGDNTLLLFGPMGKGLQEVAAGGAQTAEFLNGVAEALNNFARAIRNLPPLPDWLQKTISGDVLGGAQAAGGELRGGPGTTPTAFNPNGAPLGGVFGSAGPIISIGQMILGTEIDAQKFLDDMAARVRAAAGRVSAPPDSSAWPALNVAP